VPTPHQARAGPGFWTVEQVGERLAVGPRVKDDLIRNGGLPAQVRAGRCQVERSVRKVAHR
jgi:hypothetical protein